VKRAHDADTIYIFGHAGTNFPITGPAADLLYHRDYLTALLDFVRGEIKAGKPRGDRQDHRAAQRAFRPRSA